MTEATFWQELAESDLDLYAALLRVDRLAEPLRSAMLTAISSILDVLDAAVVTYSQAEERDAVAE